MDKILICGPRGVGKSTLIRRLTALYPGPVSGFVTKRETCLLYTSPSPRDTR